MSDTADRLKNGKGENIEMITNDRTQGLVVLLKEYQAQINNLHYELGQLTIRKHSFLIELKRELPKKEFARIWKAVKNIRDTGKEERPRAEIKDADE
jgi:hypothetical protein